MTSHIFATIIFGLAASLCWGSGDFSGGLASRRAYAGSVVLTDYAVGLVLLVTLALIGKKPYGQDMSAFHLCLFIYCLPLHNKRKCVRSGCGSGRKV